MKTMHHGAVVWIDHHQASVARLNADGEPVLTAFKSHIQDPRHSTGHVTNLPMGHGSGGGGLGDRQHAHDEKRHEQGIAGFYAQVAGALTGATDVVIIGPAQAHTEFAKALEKLPAFKGHITSEPAERMTDNQFAAFARARLIPATARAAAR